VINLSPLVEQQMRCAWTHRREFLSLGLAAAMAGCAQPLVSQVPTVQLPDWEMIKRNHETSFSGPSFERLARVGGRVLATPTKDGPWQYGVVKDDFPLVLAFRGNGLIVSTQVFELCENDGQLGALLAWVVMFPLPSLRTTGERSMRFNKDAILQADVAAMRAMAKAGYDPRDALEISRRVPIFFEEQTESELPRWPAMENELRRLGYQV
jgi:hypothetical protein